MYFSMSNADFKLKKYGAPRIFSIMKISVNINRKYATLDTKNLLWFIIFIISSDYGYMLHLSWKIVGS